MQIIEAMPKLLLHGRTLYDEQKKALFCNWSCSGFTMDFTGTKVTVSLTVLSDQIPGFPGQPAPPADFPCFGVILDGAAELDRRTNVTEDGTYVLFESEVPETHTLRFVKFSENARGKMGVLDLTVEGTLNERKWEKKPTVEIIGDSITCGFGNEAPNNAFEFKTSEENGWNSYAALAARELGYEWSMVCESGIAAAKAEHPMFPMHDMMDIYAYTDEMYDKRRGAESLTKWDFSANPSDVVVISLGTNDSNPIRFYRDMDEIDAMEQWFHRKYREFVDMVRELNGPDTYIVCALGSMDYYLYHHIRAVVEEIKAETGDEKICAFEFIPINVMFEGYGAAGHPSAKTHARMGRELAWCIRTHVK